MAKGAQANRSLKGTAVGLEFDELGVRAARVAMDGKGGFKMLSTSEVKEKFAKEADLVKALKKVRKDLGISRRDILVTCLSGKQIHASQITFKPLDEVQMTKALKLQIRKTLAFSIAGSTLEFQVLNNAKAPAREMMEDAEEQEKKKKESQIMVSAAANVLINRHLKILKRADLAPKTTEVFPVVVANSLAAQVQGAGAGKANMSLYFSPTVCHLIIDGPQAPFFHRNIYFSAGEVFNSDGDKVGPKDVERRLRSLGDEITRSRTYYENNYPVGPVDQVYISGHNAENPDLVAAIQNHTGIQLKPMNLEQRLDPKHEGPAHSPFNLALSLALSASPAVRKMQSRYDLNIIRRLRREEVRAEKRRLLHLVFRFVCFGGLGLVVLYTVLKVLTMMHTIQAERQKLRQLEQEYNKYTATKMIVNKADIELLDSLQRTRIFWTRKLASMALHLPGNYWITQFKHKNKQFYVNGYGYISPEQEQLITLDDYLNRLRRDTTFNDKFGIIYLDLAQRDDENKHDKARRGKNRVTFEYTALPKSSKPLPVRRR